MLFPLVLISEIITVHQLVTIIVKIIIYSFPLERKVRNNSHFYLE